VPTNCLHPLRLLRYASYPPVGQKESPATPGPGNGARSVPESKDARRAWCCENAIRQGRRAALAVAAYVHVPVRSGRPPSADETSGCQVDFGLALSHRTLDGALRLVHNRYVERGFMTPQLSRRRIGPHHALPTTRVFAATAGPLVVGTATLIEDSQIGLPMDEIYRSELDGFRARGQRLGEASALAADPRYRALGLALPLRVMGLLVTYAAEIAALDLLCIAVNPRHVEFYRRRLTFEVCGALRSYAKVNGAPAVALRLDLDRVRSEADAPDDVGGAGHALRSALFGPEGYRRVALHLRRQIRAAATASESFFRDRMAEDHRTAHGSHAHGPGKVQIPRRVGTDATRPGRSIAAKSGCEPTGSRPVRPAVQRSGRWYMRKALMGPTLVS
jgi:hypothetical protein